MRILITGATGFVGRALVPHLLQQADIELVLLLRETPAQRPLPTPLNRLRSQFDVVYGDLRNYNLTVRAVTKAQPERVVHLAAAGVSDPYMPVNTALRYNVNGTINLLRACFEPREELRAPAQVIVARTPGERTAMNVYAASKAAAWDFCRMYARVHRWPIQGAMIFQAYGAHQPAQSLVPAAMRAALDGLDFPMTAGTQRRDWIAVEDVAAGLAAGLRAELSPGETAELGTGTLTSVAEVVEQIYRLSARGGRAQVGVLPNRPGEEPEQVADVAQTVAQSGWRAAVALPQGLARMLDELDNLRTTAGKENP